MPAPAPVPLSTWNSLDGAAAVCAVAIDWSLSASVHVLHTAKLANGQAFARGLQVFVALVFVLAGLQALGGGGVRYRNGAVPRNVFAGLFAGFSRYRKSSGIRNEYVGYSRIHHYI